MSNPAFPDLIKIGKSKKDPTTDRVSELNQTGVPEPFKVEYYAFVEDEDYLEQEVHRYFDAERPNKSREFFTVDCAEAIVIIRQLSEPNSRIKLEEVFYIEPEELERLNREYEEQERIKEEEYQAYAEARQKEKEVERAKKKRKELTSTELYSSLLLLDESEWYCLNHGKEITKKWLAQKLLTFGIKPVKKAHANVFLIEDLQDAFDRYLPPID